MVNLKRIRVDPDGLITQNQKGRMDRIALEREVIDLFKANPENTIKDLATEHPSLREFSSETGGLDARLDIIDEPYEGLNRPLRIYYGIEPRCDLSCPMCGPRDFHEGFKPASPETEEFIMQQIANAGTFQLQLTGGEIGMRGFDLLDRVERARDFGLAVILSTNGVWRCIDKKDEFIERLADCGNIIQSKISIEGTPEFHESIRGKGTYQPTIDTLDKLSRYGLNPRISTTIFRASCNPEQLEHLVSLAQKYSAGFQPIPLRCIGKAYDMRDQTPTKEQLREYTKLATELRSETRVPITFNFDIYDQGRQVPVYDMHNPVSCGAPWFGVHITHTGEVYPCGFVQEADPHGSGGIKEPRFLAGVVSPEHSLVDIWLNSPILKEVRSAGKSDDCYKCHDYAKGCWGGCWVMAWLETGKLNGMDPYCLKQP